MKYVLGRWAHSGICISAANMVAISSKRESGIVDDVLVGLGHSQSLASRPLFD